MTVLAAVVPMLAGCAGSQLTDHDCMTRVMYFESNRSSSEGMLAVGTTVMNRLDNPKYPKTVCEVVGQRNQFAPGVLDRPVNPREAALSSQMADRVLNGERHPQLPPNAMFFHTAGLTFPYTNMHYLVVAGGNAFYEKLGRSEMAALRAATPRPTEEASPRQDVADGGQSYVSTFDPAAADAGSVEGEPAAEE
jgi:spore germination cell wall hydrolase CwlJ-like protein